MGLVNKCHIKWYMLPRNTSDGFGHLHHITFEDYIYDIDYLGYMCHLSTTIGVVNGGWQGGDFINASFCQGR